MLSRAQHLRKALGGDPARSLLFVKGCADQATGTPSAASKRGPSSAACIITTFAFDFQQGQEESDRIRLNGEMPGPT